jgi:predicted house-cleaning noncanonical NTP pyrophosphatase (MazG superfamily)
MVDAVHENTNQAYAEEPAVGDSDELTPYQQALYNQHRLQQLIEQKNKEELANLLEDRTESWNRIEQVVNAERIRVWGGKNGDTLKDVYQFVQGASLIKGAIDQVGEWAGYVTNTDEAADKAADKILSEPFSSSMTMEQVADQGLKLMSQMANVPTVIHFGYYQQQYQKYSQELTAEAAHEKAMEDLRNMMLNPTQEFMEADGGRVVKGAWDIRFEKNAEPGGLYDGAFFDLRNITPPGVSK